MAVALWDQIYLWNQYDSTVSKLAQLPPPKMMDRAAEYFSAI